MSRNVYPSPVGIEGEASENGSHQEALGPIVASNPGVMFAPP